MKAPMPWLKIWTEARIDAKLGCLSDSHFRLWFKLLCFASEQEPRGTIKASLKIIAAEVAGGDVEMLDLALREIEGLGLVTVVTDHDMSQVSQLGHNVTVTGCHSLSQIVTEITFKSFVKRQQNPPSWSRERQNERQARCRASKKLERMSQVSQPVTTQVTTQSQPEEEEDEEKKTPPTPSKGARVPFVPPDWIPRQDWDDWIAARKKKPTLRAMGLAVTKLGKLQAQGHTPADVLQDAILGGWTGLWAPSSNGHARTNGNQLKSSPALTYLDDAS